jgi:uncharacterized SAM-binding protein YcdF (DUF218 family)
VIRRLLLVVAVLVGAWLVAAFFLFARPDLPSPPAHVDAVVVLSGARNTRLDPGLELIREGAAPVLAISGALQDPHWPKAQAICRAGHVAGARVICFDPKPFSTRGESRAVARLARQHGWNEVVVVTSTFHVTRARMLFHRCYPGKLWFVGTPTTWWRIPEEWAFETGKLAVQLTAERGC